MTTTQGRDVRAAATQPEQLEAFYREQLPFVRQYVARRLDDPSDVADVTADIFVRVIRSATTYRADLGPPRAWLTGIARNAVAEHLRAGAAHQTAVRQLGGRGCWTRTRPTASCSASRPRPTPGRCSPG